MPDLENAELESAAEAYNTTREDCLKNMSIGITELFNAANNPKITDPLVNQYRARLVDLDVAVCKAYGWSDLDLLHDYYTQEDLSEDDSIRFSISPEAKDQFISRLSVLNRKKHDEELELAEKTLTSPAKRGRRPKAAPNQSVTDLFAGEGT